MAVEMDLLDQLLKVCKKHDIKVIIYAGTLLGAIRHKGLFLGMTILMLL